MLRELRLGAVVRHAQEVAIRAEREGWSFTRYLHDLVEMELLERLSRRMQRRLKESGLPIGKTLTPPGDYALARACAPAAAHAL